MTSLNTVSAFFTHFYLKRMYKIFWRQLYGTPAASCFPRSAVVGEVAWLHGETFTETFKFSRCRKHKNFGVKFIVVTGNLRELGMHC
jgi:hypothetical protein